MLANFKVYQLAKEIHWASKSLKISRFIQDQLLRASASVVLNIAEGSGKRTPAEQGRFYGIALGSLRECQAIWDLEKVEDVILRKKADEVGAILYVLTNRKQY